MSPTQPIIEQCRDPAKTRLRAMAGQPVPCFRCLAYRPETATGCHFLNRKTQVSPVSPTRQPKIEQETIW
jgi:hypothetical protein